MEQSLHFSPEQYERLMKLVYLGNWVINAHRIDDRRADYDALEEYIFSRAADFGLSTYVDDKDIIDGRRFFPNQRFEEETEVHVFQEEYDDESFWEDLASRLAERDVEHEQTTMNETGLQRLWKLENAYQEEFEKNGIERLRLKDEDTEE